MVELATLTDEQKRIRIAETCGWRMTYSPWGLPPGKTTPESQVRIPDYLNDLNAMREAEEKLTARERAIYALILNRIQWLEDDPDEFAEWVDHWKTEGCKDEWIEQTALSTFVLLHAPAAQRAEAFLLTLAKP